jgi:hypothetical protein
MFIAAGLVTSALILSQTSMVSLAIVLATSQNWVPEIKDTSETGITVWMVSEGLANARRPVKSSSQSVLGQPPLLESGLSMTELVPWLWVIPTSLCVSVEGVKAIPISTKPGTLVAWPATFKPSSLPYESQGQSC